MFPRTRRSASLFLHPSAFTPHCNHARQSPRLAAHRRIAAGMGKRSGVGVGACVLHPFDRGQATVELLLILFIFVVLIFGAFELGKGIALKHALDVATEKAARLLSIDPTDFSSADALIRAEVNASLLGGGYGGLVTIGLYDAGTHGPIAPDDVAAAPFSYRFIVQASVPFAADVPFLNLAGRTITASHYGIVDRVLPSHQQMGIS